MANNVNLPAQGTGDTTPKVSTDQVTADQSQVQNFQLAAVAGGVLTRNPTIPVSAASLPLPAGAATETTLAALNVLEGAVNETAPASDTANSGLNGRLQRIAQRLTSLIALLPASLGQKTMANGLAVTIASDQSTVNVAQTGALPAGANAIGKLAANSGVDIGDVDVTSLPAIPAGNNNIGDVDIASIATPTSGGYSVQRLLSGASTNATSVKASAGQVYGWYLANAAAYTVFFKLYNKASAPTVGSDTPFMTIPVPAGAAANVEFMRGIAMGTGVAFATTKLVADADTTALVANDLVINLFYA